MKALLFVDRFIARIAGWLLVLVLSVMIVMSFGQVMLRNFFDTSIEWGDILLRHLVLWVGFLGATVASGEGRHIKLELLTKFVSARVQRILGALSSLFAALICVLLFHASIVFINIGIDPESILILHIPTWYFVVIFPAGYGLMAFRFAIVALEHIVHAVHGEWELKASR
ncbi:MAG: TRAP transporter small permease subunit [Bacteroidota bacterium]|nr:TRAP transporter small permease subunit [Bacteroidota bacterium]